MPSRNLLSRWLGKRAQPDKDVSTAMPSVADKEEDIAPEKEQDSTSASVHVLSLKELKQRWTDAPDLMSRTLLIKEHPAFQDAQFQQLDMEMILAFLVHLQEVRAHCKMLEKQRVAQWDSLTHEAKTADIEAGFHPSLSLGYPKKFLALQQRGFELSPAHPQDAAELHSHLFEHWSSMFPESNNSPYSNPNTQYLLAGLEQLASVGFLPDTTCLSDMLCDASCTKPYARTYLEEFPKLYALWAHCDNDQTVLQWALKPENGAWAVRCHPRINEWSIAENIVQRCSTLQIRQLLTQHAEHSPNGALLKAWYGLELSVDEIAKHPLAHSLYVHKHAPAYLEEVQPLPTTWSMALALSTTGGEFFDMLLVLAKAKMEPKQPAVLVLPDFGEQTHGHQ